MMSARRIAQLGLGGASLVLIASVAVLLKGAADSAPQSMAVTGTAVQSHSTSLTPTILSKP